MKPPSTHVWAMDVLMFSMPSLSPSRALLPLLHGVFKEYDFSKELQGCSHFQMLVFLVLILLLTEPQLPSSQENRKVHVVPSVWNKLCLENKITPRAQSQPVCACPQNEIQIICVHKSSCALQINLRVSPPSCLKSAGRCWSGCCWNTHLASLKLGWGILPTFARLRFNLDERSLILASFPTQRWWWWCCWSEHLHTRWRSWELGRSGDKIPPNLIFRWFLCPAGFSSAGVEVLGHLFCSRQGRALVGVGRVGTQRVRPFLKDSLVRKVNSSWEVLGAAGKGKSLQCKKLGVNWCWGMGVVWSQLPPWHEVTAAWWGIILGTKSTAFNTFSWSHLETWRIFSGFLLQSVAFGVVSCTSACWFRGLFQTHNTFLPLYILNFSLAVLGSTRQVWCGWIRDWWTLFHDWWAPLNQGKRDPDTALEKGLVHLVNFCFLSYLFLILMRKKTGKAEGILDSSSDSTPGRSKEHQIVMRLPHF